MVQGNRNMQGVPYHFLFLWRRWLLWQHTNL